MGVDDDPGGWTRGDWWNDSIEPPDYIPPDPEAEDLATYIAFSLRDLNPEISRAQTGSIYIRFGTLRHIGALRIADHPGYVHYKYKWNLIDWRGEEDFAIVNDKGVNRRYYKWKAADLLIGDIRLLASPKLPKGESMKKIGDRLPPKPQAEPDPFDEEEEDDPFAEDKSATVHASATRSRPGQADEELVNEHVEPPQVRLVEADEPHSEVEVSIGETINTGNYNSVRIHVNVRVPALQGIEDDYALYAEHVARQHLERIAEPYRK